MSLSPPPGELLPPELRQRFRELARDLPGVDLAAYGAAGRDPREPIVGLGPPDAALAIFGRDPGRDEVQHGLPFVGAGGQKLRRGLWQHRHGGPMPDFAASIAIGQTCWWANTVPYKPVGNKAWPMAVKRRFRPLMAELFLDHWTGTDVLTLGREAFLWFGIDAPGPEREALEAFWQREDRFDSHHPTPIVLGARRRMLHLWPLPHPSPLNATWYRRFPELLAARLETLDPRPTALPQRPST